MKKTTNKTQTLYMLAKARLQVLEDREKELEHQYIVDNEITNQDGTVPNYIYCIDSEEVFNKANEAQSTTIEASGLWREILAAKEALKIAEERLIEYGLSIAPDKQRAILEKAVKENYTTRLKIIDLVLRLDASTVK